VGGQVGRDVCKSSSLQQVLSLAPLVFMEILHMHQGENRHK
jgi:hypothetical protein